MGNTLPSFCCFNINDQRRREDVSCCSNNINNDQHEDKVGTPWSDLPDLALHTILMHLREAAAAYTAFRGVCRAWRAVAISASSVRPPILAFLPSKGKISLLSLHDNNQTYNKSLLETRKLSYAGQSHGYLIMKSGNCTLVVINPCTSATWELPPPPVPNNFEFEFCLLSAAPTSPNCLLLLLSFSVIQWCRIGGDHRWSRWYPPGGPYFSSSALVYKEKMLYWTDWRGRICEMDLQQCSYDNHSSMSKKSLLKRTVLDTPAFEWPHNVEPVLAELDGQLLMITVSYTDNLNFRRPFVYRLDLSSTEKRWEKMESLGFYSVFVSGSNCEIYDTRRVEGLLSNCVYYATNSMYYIIESLDGVVKESGGHCLDFRKDKSSFWIHYKAMGYC